MELQGRVDELTAQGLGLTAISYDSPELLADFSRRHRITFPLLSDTGSATITTYGILNTVADEALETRPGNATLREDVKKYVATNGSRSVAELTKGTPFPGTFVVDREGRVTARFFEEYYRERNTASSILLRLGNGAPPVAATRIAAAHLDITAYASDSTVSPGTRFALAVSVVPRPRIHVYAPGADANGYRVVSLSVAPQPFVRTLPIRYPPSEIYDFKPLDERVPVYRKAFTLLREVVVEVTSEAERALRDRKTLTMTGVLEYQACDDKVCFTPATVPLTWTVALTPNITERPNRPQ